MYSTRDKAQGFLMRTVTKSCLVQVAVSRRERERWGEAARRADMTLSELVRESVRVRLAGIVHVVDAAAVRAAIEERNA
jgi:hypothetical protein